MIYQIDICEGDLVLFDEDGNSYECLPLTTYRAAKRAVQRWVWRYPLNVADAYRMLLNHFSK